MLIFILLLTAGFGGFTTYAIYIRSHWLPSSCERSALQPIEDEYINSETKRVVEVYRTGRIYTFFIRRVVSKEYVCHIEDNP
jgi:hypothetical protein